MRAFPVHVLPLLTTIAVVACMSAVGNNALTVRRAQDASVVLEPGMTRDQVVQVLGNPTDTESQTMGQKTDSGAWQALVWNYRWADGFSGESKRLVLYFAEGDEWRLNHWRWYDF